MRNRTGSRGVTLIELMVAVAILSIGVLGLIGAMGGIQKSIQISKNKTLASNLAQEKMQILKQKNYYQVLVTTSPTYDTNYTPNIPYDGGYFPPESILEGGVNYRRLTYIQVAREDSGNIVTLPPTTADTGMRLITVTVTWGQGGDKKKLEVRNILANPDTVMSNAIFSGTVRNASTFVAITGVLVNIAENIGWRDTANAVGAYTINLSPGNHTMMASAQGYFSELRVVSIAANQSLTQDFNLVPIASGTVQGTVWLNDHLVLSQVVGSTVDANSYSQEYVEVFNPTTYTWTMSGNIGLKFQRPADGSRKTILINYSATTIAPGGFFLFANTGTVTAGGAGVAADATWSPANNAADFPYFGTQMNIITTSDQPSEGGGAVELYKVSDGSTLDILGWDRNNGGQSAPFFETDGLNESIGLQLEEQYVRYSSTSGVSTVFGPAYDSGNNTVDWTNINPLNIPPKNSGVAAQTVIAGVPAAGAVISCTDGLSISTAAVLTGTPPRANFTLTQVATGTWTAFLSSRTYHLENTTITIAATGSVYTFPSSTTILTQSNFEGFISGTVTNALGAAISPGIVVSPEGAGVDATASTLNGGYLLRVTPGLINVTANPNNVNSSYVSQSSQALTINLGEVKSGVNFVLSQGGRVTGFVTRDGINALPGIAVAALDSNGSSRDQQVTDSSGRFTTVSIATGVYSIEPAVGSHETSIPPATSVTVTIGATVSAGTFTITGALGTIRGSVSAGGTPLRVGALIVVTTITLAGTPPAPPSLSSATLTGTPYYITSSNEDGTYSVDVRQSTSPAYRVYGYYTTFSGQTPVITSLVNTGVSVTAGQTVSGVNFAW